MQCEGRTGFIEKERDGVCDVWWEDTRTSSGRLSSHRLSHERIEAMSLIPLGGNVWEGLK